MVEDMSLEELVGRMDKEDAGEGGGGGKRKRDRNVREVDEWRFVKMLVKEFFQIRVLI